MLIIILAEFNFALAAFCTKMSYVQGGIPGPEASFFRFLLGFLVALLILKVRRQSLKANRLPLVIWRGVFNSLALVFFSLGLQMTTVTNGNMLNMTYPLFVFLLAPFLNKEKTSPWFWPLLVSAMAGITLVIHPEFTSINPGDILSLISGVLAAFGVTTLNLARKHDTTFTILFYMMGVGALVTGVTMIPVFIVPGVESLLPLAGTMIFGVLGQIFITYGYGFVTARTGSLLSTSRILFSTILGMVFLQEVLNWMGWTGAVLILGALVGVALLTGNKKTRKTAVEGV